MADNPKTDGKALAAAISVKNATDIPVVNPRGLSAVYSNNIGISATMLDYTLIFLETGQTPGENGPVQKSEVKALVTLPIPSAVALIGALQHLLEQSTARMQAETDAIEAEAKGQSGEQ